MVFIFLFMKQTFIIRFPVINILLELAPQIENHKINIELTI